MYIIINITELISYSSLGLYSTLRYKTISQVYEGYLRLNAPPTSFKSFISIINWRVIYNQNTFSNIDYEKGISIDI